MNNLNSVILEGNLTKDQEIRYTPNGSPICNFSIAVNRTYKQGDEKKEEVCFVDIVVFGKFAEVCHQHLAKGRPVIVKGRLQQRHWESKDGKKQSKHEVVAEEVFFRWHKKENEEQAQE